MGYRRLWNTYDDRVFDVEAPDGVTIVGYVDDLAVVAVVKNGTILQNKINTALREVSEWLRSRNLEVAPEKTEVVLLRGRRKLSEITVQMCDRDITSQRYLKYLGVIIDKDMRMIEHVRCVAKRASEVVASLCRIMSNIGGPR